MVNGKILMNTLLASSLMLTGCAGMIDGTTQELAFETTPSGATVLGDGQKELGVTPFKMNVSKNETGIFVIKKEGYKPQIAKASKKKSSSFNWNYATLGFYPLFGFVDEMTGAKYLFTRTKINVELVELAEQAEEKGH